MTPDGPDSRASATLQEENNASAWVSENRVCWEIAPHYERHHRARVQTGFELTLFARRPPHCTGDPGCPACCEVHEGLREIALRALPVGSRYEMGPFDAAFHQRPECGWQPELRLVLQILHHHGTFEPVDDEERDQAKAIERAFEQMGLRRRFWPERAP